MTITITQYPKGEVLHIPVDNISYVQEFGGMNRPPAMIKLKTGEWIESSTAPETVRKSMDSAFMKINNTPTG